MMDLTKLKDEWNAVTSKREEADIKTLKLKQNIESDLSTVSSLVGIACFLLSYFQYFYVGFIGLTVIGCGYSIIFTLFALSFINDRNRLSTLIYLKKINGEK